MKAFQKTILAGTKPTAHLLGMAALKYMNYAEPPTPKLVREKHDVLYCTTFDVDNFLLGFVGDDFVKFPDVKLVGFDETW